MSSSKHPTHLILSQNSRLATALTTLATTTVRTTTSTVAKATTPTISLTEPVKNAHASRHDNSLALGRVDHPCSD